MKTTLSYLLQTAFKPTRRFRLRTILNLFIPLFIGVPVTGQNVELLATINPTTGVVTQIHPIPGVLWIKPFPPSVTIDPINGRYYFTGMTSTSVETIYSSNINTGELRTIGNYTPNVVMGSGVILGGVGNFEYNESSGYINGVGVFSSQNSQGLGFFRLDTSNAQITVMGSLTLPPMTPIMIQNYSSTFDQAGQRYFIMESNKIYGFNATTGAPLSSCEFIGSNNISFLRYNNATGKAYVIRRFPNPAQLLEVNITTCQILDTVALLPYYTPIGWGPAGPFDTRASLDQQRNVYTFGDYGSNFLHSIDLATGAHTAAPSFTFINTATSENVIEFMYNRLNGLLYALNWGVPEIFTPLNDLQPLAERKTLIFPNPSSASIGLLLQDPENCTGIVVTDMRGATVRELKSKEVQKLLEIRNLKAGVYTVEVIYTSGTEKLRAVLE